MTAKYPSAKYKSARDALATFNLCFDAAKEASSAAPDELSGIVGAICDAANDADVPEAIRAQAARIALDAFAFLSDTQKAALEEARSETGTALQKARVEKRRAVEAAISERKALERLALALFLCVVSGVALYFTPCPYSLVVPLAFALYVLKFRRAIKSLRELNPFAPFRDNGE